MGNVTVPHFGVHLDAKTFKNLKQRLIDKNIKFIDPPYIRFKGGYRTGNNVFSGSKR